MKLYKYRSLEQIEFTLDILLNERLHCAHYEKLNDPFEGLFLSVMHFDGPLNFGMNIFGLNGTVKNPQTISELPILGSARVCSLSASNSDVRLWSHYANGHTGIAIEIEVDEEKEELHGVEYVKELKELTYSLLTTPKAEEILRVKSKHWDYESEYRIITDQEFYSIGKSITGIYLGLRTPLLLRQMLLKSVGDAIPVFTTKLNEKTIEIELNKVLQPTAKSGG